MRELAVVAQRYARAQRRIPEIAARALVDVVFGDAVAIQAVVIVGAPPVGIGAGDGLLDVIRRVRRGRPVVAVAAHLPVHEEAVEDAEPLGERVRVGCHRAREERERGVTIGEHLVIGAILANDVDDVAERRQGR